MLSHLKTIHLGLHKPPPPLWYSLSTLICPLHFSSSFFLDYLILNCIYIKWLNFTIVRFVTFAVVPLIGRTEAGKCRINCGNGQRASCLISIPPHFSFLPFHLQTSFIEFNSERNSCICKIWTGFWSRKKEKALELRRVWHCWWGWGGIMPGILLWVLGVAGAGSMLGN